jgi:hypothetical protein
MDLKEKMMESMMGKMSTEEKKEMMESMMEKFFKNMTEDEKKEMMQSMMPKMMGQMMGGGGMMGMMSSMMGGGIDKGEGGSNPMNMCKEMMTSMKQSRQMASFATEEVQHLFSEWAEQIENEILDILDKDQSASVVTIGEKLHLSEKSVLYFLGRMAQAGQIQLHPSK